MNSINSYSLRRIFAEKNYLVYPGLSLKEFFPENVIMRKHIMFIVIILTVFKYFTFLLKALQNLDNF